MKRSLILSMLVLGCGPVGAAEIDGGQEAGLVCGEGTTRCEGACVDLDSSRAHCGMCGNACGAGIACRGGLCVGLEPDGGVAMDAGSVDAATDDAGSADAATDAGSVDAGSGDGVAPSVGVVFPPERALTDAPTILVRGTATDADGVAAVRVSGVEAESSDAFATWTARVPLVFGENELVVEAEDTFGTLDDRAATRDVRQTPMLLRDTNAAAADPAGGRLFVTSYTDAEDAIVSVDLATGERRNVSGGAVGSGPALTGGVTGLAWDATSGRVLVPTFNNSALYAVDVATGARTLISGPARGAGPTIDHVSAVVVANGGSTALVAHAGAYGDSTDDAVIAVDLVTGDRTVVASDGVGSGPALFGSQALALRDAATLLVSTGYPTYSLLQVDLATGARAVVSGSSRGSGPSFSVPREIVLGAGGESAYVLDANAGLLEVDLATGDRTVLLTAELGDGTAPSSLDAMAMLSPDELAIVDERRGAIIGFTLSTGALRFISESSLGAGAPLVGVDCLDVLGSSAELIVDGFWTTDEAALHGVSLLDGARRVLSGALRGAGPAVDANGCAVLPSAVAVIDSSGSLFRVDPASGDRTVVSDASHGTGPELGRPRALSQGPAGSVLLVDDEADALVRVELATGDRVVLSDSTHTPPLDQARQTLFLPSEDIALVATSAGLVSIDLSDGSRSRLALGSSSSWMTGLTIASDGRLWALRHVSNNAYELWAIDPVAGSFEVVSDATRGGGPALVTVSQLAREPASGLLYTYASEYAAVYAIDPVTGERVIASR